MKDNDEVKVFPVDGVLEGASDFPRCVLSLRKKCTGHMVSAEYHGQMEAWKRQYEKTNKRKNKKQKKYQKE